MKEELLASPGHSHKTEEAPEQETFLLDLLLIVAAKRKFVFWFTLGAALLALIAALIIPNNYTATTLILPPAQNAPSGSALLSQLGGSGGIASLAGASLGMKNPGDMYVTLFRSQSVEDSMVRRFKLMDRYHTKRLSDARIKFEDLSTVILGAKDGLIFISVTDKDPRMAAELANGYVEEFHNRSATLAITEASQRRAFFQQQLFEANENLANAEEALKQTEETTGVLQVDSQAKSLIESAAVLRAKIGMKQVELQGIRSGATENNPQIVMGEQQLAALKSQLASLEGSDQDSNSDLMLSKEKIPQAGLEYARRLRDVKYYETIMEILARQFEMAKEDEARQGAIIQIADPATVPDRKSSPHRLIIVLLGTMVGFIVSLLCIIANARWNQILRDPVIAPRLQALSEAFRPTKD